MREYTQRQRLTGEVRVLDSGESKSWEPPWETEVIPRRSPYSQFNTGESAYENKVLRGGQGDSGSRRLRDTGLIVQTSIWNNLTERLAFIRPGTKDVFATGISIGPVKSLSRNDQNASSAGFAAKLQRPQDDSRSEQVTESGDSEEAAFKPEHTANEAASTQTLNAAMPIDLPLQFPLAVRPVSQVDAVANERSELLARKHGGGQPLSMDEQERLEALTTRLKELLPPVSLGELEALLEMTEEAERIRERARERRRRLGLS